MGTYNSREYNDLIYAKEEEQQYAQERAYRQRAAQFEEQNRREQEQRAQNQVLTLPDGSVTSRITWDDHPSAAAPARSGPGRSAPFQLVPGVPIQGDRDAPSAAWSAWPAVWQQPTRILMEEYSGTPGVPGQYAWTRDLSTGEAETVLRGWLRGELPALEGWTKHGALRPRLAAGGWSGRGGPPPHSAPAKPGLALGPDCGRVSRQRL